MRLSIHSEVVVTHTKELEFDHKAVTRHKMQTASVASYHEDNALGWGKQSRPNGRRFELASLQVILVHLARPRRRLHMHELPAEQRTHRHYGPKQAKSQPDRLLMCRWYACYRR